MSIFLLVSLTLSFLPRSCTGNPLSTSSLPFRSMSHRAARVTLLRHNPCYSLVQDSSVASFGPPQKGRSPLGGSAATPAPTWSCSSSSAHTTTSNQALPGGAGLHGFAGCPSPAGIHPSCQQLLSFEHCLLCEFFPGSLSAEWTPFLSCRNRLEARK